MATKTICFDCCEYSLFNKEGQCYKCKGVFIARTGSAFRLPAKKSKKAWKELKEIFILQCSHGAGNDILFGFGNNANYHGFSHQKGIPRKLKEKASLAGIKAAYTHTEY